MRGWLWVLGGLVLVPWFFACGDDHTNPVRTTTSSSTGGGMGGEGGQGDTLPEPGAAFDRYCLGEDWSAARAPATPGSLGGAYLGVLMDPLPNGTLSMMKVIPEHPFWATTIRVAFGGSAGQGRLRLMTTFGRSYPGGWPDIDDAAANLIAPIDVDVDASADPDAFVTFDIAIEGVFLEPTQHYAIVFEQLGGDTKLAVEELNGEPASRALLLVPGEDVPFGLGEANFRLAVEGQYFCAWSDRWFAVRDTPFSNLTSGSVNVVDLDGDGHDDVLVKIPAPTLYRGDGAGSFTLAPGDPFVDARDASLLVFVDLDDDGDRDAFAGHYVTPNSDGDAFTIAEGDCNDADASVHPNASEQTNGWDDDCDGVADDGTDTSDADQDGFSIAAGDCDDTRADVWPGAPETLDARDNDCDLAVDEDFVNRVLINDGSGQLAMLPAAGVETLDPTTTAAFGDADGDGDLDLYWGNWLEHYPDFPAVQHRFVMGNGDGTFVDATTASGVEVATPRPSYGVTWNDYDDDGRQDIFVSNYQLSNNHLWHNQGDGTFVDVAAAANVDHDDEPTISAQYPGGHSYGASVGDIDLDGDMDLFVPNLAHPRTMPWSDTSQLLLNSGPPSYTFVDAADAWGILYNEGDVNSVLFDYDNDTDLDLFVGSAYPTHYSILYRNDGARGFTDVSYETGTTSHLSGSAAVVDVDEDGDLDLLTSQAFGPPYVRLFENLVGQDNGWVMLELEGTTTNRDAIGARVTLQAGGVTQMREVQGGTALALQHTHLVHFGLGDAASIQSVTVRWVGGATEIFAGVVPKGRFRLIEGSGQAAPL